MDIVKQTKNYRIIDTTTVIFIVCKSSNVEDAAVKWILNDEIVYCRTNEINEKKHKSQKYVQKKLNGQTRKN